MREQTVATAVLLALDRVAQRKVARERQLDLRTRRQQRLLERERLVERLRTQLLDVELATTNRTLRLLARVAAAAVPFGTRIPRRRAPVVSVSLIVLAVVAVVVVVIEIKVINLTQTNPNRNRNTQQNKKI